MPLAELHGKHLVTVEGLNMANPSPVQQAIIETGATQCGFCTPGIVVSLTGLLMENAKLDKKKVREALSGHLCRCTGYRSLKEAGDQIIEMVTNTGVEALTEAQYLPAYFNDIPGRLNDIGRPAESDGTAREVLIAGGTDLFVQHGDEIPDLNIGVLNNRTRMSEIRRGDDGLHIGALTTFEAFAKHPDVQAMLPAITANMSLIASRQIRNRATLGGNIINASPIGDMTILLMALNAELVFDSAQGIRTVLLTRFFESYKQFDMSPGELLTEIRLPWMPNGSRFNWEKVSKRKYLDIASVNSGCLLKVTDGLIETFTLTMGGVAPVPLYLRQMSDFFVGKSVSRAVLHEAFSVLQSEINPISDIRGSAKYKRLLARQLLLAHFIRFFPDQFDVRACYESS